MATLTVEGKQFDLDTLADNAKANASAVAFADNKIKQLEQDLALAKAARSYYVAELIKSLPTDDQDDKTAKKPTRKRAPAKKATTKTSSRATKTAAK